MSHPMRDPIIDSSLQLFLKKGIRKMTVQQLVKPLGISTKTFYNYFADKEELLRACLLRHYAALAEAYERLPVEHGDPVITLLQTGYRAIAIDFGVNRIFYHDLNYYYPALQDRILDKFFSRHNARLANLVRRGIRAGQFRKEVDPALVPEVMGILYASITRTDQFKNFGLTPADLMKNTIEAYLRGICTNKGLAVIKKNYSSLII